MPVMMIRKARAPSNNFRYVIPVGYLGGKKKMVRSVQEAPVNYDGDQALMDSIYDQLVEVMVGGLQKVKCRSTGAARQERGGLQRT